MSREEKKSRLEGLLSDLDGADAFSDPECVEKLTSAWLQRMEEGELAAWEIYGAAMHGLIEGRKKPRWAKKPVMKKNIENQKPTKRRRKPHVPARDNAAFLNSEFEGVPRIDVIKANIRFLGGLQAEDEGCDVESQLLCPGVTAPAHGQR